MRTKFDHEWSPPVVRDNVRASGYYYDEDDVLGGGTLETGVVYMSSLYGTEHDLLFEYEGHDLYSFNQPLDQLPLALQPFPATNTLTLALFTSFQQIAAPVYAAQVNMDPEVIVLPVYTWTLHAEDSTYSHEDDLSLAGMRWAFDRGETSSSTSHLPADIWEPIGGQRVDSIWTQCNIQFRVMQHRDIVVPSCYAMSPYPARDDPNPMRPSSCFSCPYGNEDCPQDVPAQPCDCTNGKQCSLPVFLRKEGYHVPDAINIYFVADFSSDYDPFVENLGITCSGNINQATGHSWPWTMIASFHLFDDAARTVLAHEIGHTLLEDSGHTPGTLMEAGNHSIVTLTPEQCQIARTQHTVVLSSAL